MSILSYKNRFNSSTVHYLKTKPSTWSWRMKTTHQLVCSVLNRIRFQKKKLTNANFEYLVLSAMARHASFIWYPNYVKSDESLIRSWLHSYNLCIYIYDRFLNYHAPTFFHFLDFVLCRGLSRSADSQNDKKLLRRQCMRDRHDPKIICISHDLNQSPANWLNHDHFDTF